MYAQEKDGLDRKTIQEIRSFTKQSVTEDNLTDVVLERWKDIPDPRLRQIMQSLIKHLHGFVREIEPTEAEWATAIDWLQPAVGAISRYPFVTVEWARKWPCEEVWKARKPR